MRVAIIGAGVIGLTTAWVLLRRNCAVTVYEKARPGGRGAASAGQLRIFGAYLRPSCAKVAAVNRAGSAWDGLFRELSVDLLFRRGVLRLVRSSDDSRVQASSLEQACRRNGVPVERISRNSAAGRFPFLELAHVEEALVLYDWGFFAPRRILARLARLLSEGGARLHSNHEVRELDAERGEVGTDRGGGIFDAVVLAGGAAAPRLVPELCDKLALEAFLTLRLHPSAERVRAWVRSPVILDPDGFAGAITPSEGGADLALRSLLPWVDEEGSAVCEPPRDLLKRPSTRAFYAAGLGLLRAPDRFPPKAADVAWEAASSDGKPLRWRRGRLLALGGMEGDAFQFAPLIADSAARCLLDEVDSERAFDWI